jgi:hypothetical protein
MKNPLIAALAVVSLFFAACGKKSTENTSSSSSPPLNPRYVAEDPSNDSTVSPSSLADESQQEQATPSPSPTASSGQLVFKSQAANKAAKQYLDTYNRVRNDVAADLGTHPVNPTDPRAAIEGIRGQLQKIGRDTKELANQQKQVESLLAPEEKKRFREYQKSLEQPAQDPN